MGKLFSVPALMRDMSCQSVGSTFNSFNTKIKVLKIANTTCPNLFEHVLNKLSQLIYLVVY